MRFPDLSTLKQRGTEKWSCDNPDTVPMFVAESDFATNDEVMAAIRDAVDREQLGYPCQGDTRLAEALSDFCASRYGWRPRAEWVFPIADVVRGLWMAIETFTRPGSAIVFATPAYPPFFELGTLAGRESVTVGVTVDGGMDLAAVERAFQQGAGCFVLCNPHNPLGLAFDRETLVRLADLAAAYDARIISDEIHAPLVFGRRHIPAASVSEAAASVTVTLMAASKAWNVAGLKCAQLIVSNERDAQVWAERPPLYWQGFSILGYEASVACYRADQSFVDEQLEYVGRNIEYAVSRLRQVVPGIGVYAPEATYLLWLDFRNTVLGEAAWEVLATEASVVCSDGRAFAGESEGAGWVRMNLACQDSTLRLALDRIEQVVAARS
ncbi:MalY/PatB family protein [Corynebacterium aquilae]|uniref:cysteine-S-conjugate beta-lyase n=1 Tax=Corynebacterium aquilae DSM 44791 TaxID=1431546 RepID=A0A1L7CH96_9CORY|nr:aminotransferase class I/II-fold pyridoxal phosphate-dependent enzyme [Corynebacterium aquilae]APT85216.1 hypothetical protein CAQU_09185 [Corynebacterium aquilae DSM 44791]